MPGTNHYKSQSAKKKQTKVVLKRRYISDVVEVEEKPPPKPAKIHDAGVGDEVLTGLADAFELLYDPNYFGHLDFEDQLKKFKSRDLLEAKLYKTALKAFGNQRFVRERLAKDNGRKRIFVAQPLSELRGFDSFSSASCLPSISGHTGRATDSAVSGADASSVEDPSTKEMSRYQQWFKKRQLQHQDLERLGDVERYLRGKGGQLSTMERAALRRIDDGRRQKEVEHVVVEVAETRTRPPSKVSVKRPSPLALFIIDSELRKRKLRLSDLFTSIDKDKDWLLTRDEFRKAMRQNRVPLPEPLLEDMIITLDQDNNNQLDYRELAQGLEQYRRERRSPEFLALLSEESNQFLLARGSEAEAGAANSPSGGSGGPGSPDSAAAATDAAATAASVAASGNSIASSSPRLKPGEFDTSQECYSVNNAEASAELRRHDQVALRYMRKGRQRGEEFRSMVKTFDRDIDDHVTLSSLPERPLADQVDAFRQRQLREFMAVVDACKERGVVFSERLYRRVFLYPADRTRKQIGDEVAPPGSNAGELPLSVLMPPGQRAALVAATGARSGGDPAAAGGVGGAPGGSGGAVGRAPWLRQNGGSGGGAGVGGGRASNLARLGRVLPTRRDLLVDDDDAEMELPTGTALVRRKVDCWLTFEEFQSITAKLDYSGQAQLRGPRKDAFWPGRLEGRVRRFLEAGLDGSSAYGPNLMFQPTQPQRGARSHPYLPRETWPVVEGHVTYGSIDPMLAHDITGGPKRMQSKVAL